MMPMYCGIHDVLLTGWKYTNTFYCIYWRTKHCAKGMQYLLYYNVMFTSIKIWVQTFVDSRHTSSVYWLMHWLEVFTDLTGSLICNVCVLPQTDGLMRVNGEHGAEEKSETPVSPVRPVSFSPTPPKPATKGLQQEPEISPASETTSQEHTQTASTASSQVTEKIKEEKESLSSPQEKSKEEEASTMLPHSEVIGLQLCVIFAFGLK